MKICLTNIIIVHQIFCNLFFDIFHILIAHRILNRPLYRWLLLIGRWNYWFCRNRSGWICIHRLCISIWDIVIIICRYIRRNSQFIFQCSIQSLPFWILRIFWIISFSIIVFTHVIIHLGLRRSHAKMATLRHCLVCGFSMNTCGFFQIKFRGFFYEWLRRYLSSTWRITIWIPAVIIGKAIRILYKMSICIIVLRI